MTKFKGFRTVPVGVPTLWVSVTTGGDATIKYNVFAVKPSARNFEGHQTATLHS